jgi:hypothetical protein
MDHKCVFPKIPERTSWSWPVLQERDLWKLNLRTWNLGLFKCRVCGKGRYHVLETERR